MATRYAAEAAIQTWNRMGFLQKELAWRAGVRDTTISHIVHAPWWTASEDLYERICEAVRAEEAKRIDSIPMDVTSLCTHSVPLDAETRAAIASSIRAVLRTAKKKVMLPDGVTGSLVKLVHEDSGLLLIAIDAATDEQKIALAHELEHLRMIVLQSIRKKFKSPRSSY